MPEPNTSKSKNDRFFGYLIIGVITVIVGFLLGNALGKSEAQEEIVLDYNKKILHEQDSLLRRSEELDSLMSVTFYAFANELYDHGHTDLKEEKEMKAKIDSLYRERRATLRRLEIVTSRLEITLIHKSKK